MDETGQTDLPLPRGMSTRSEGADLVIERRWFSPVFLPLLLFCAIWDGFLLVTTKAPVVSTPVGQIPLLLVLPHFYVGLGLTYFLFCLLFNRTTFRINMMRLQVEVGPLPAFGNKRIPSEEIDQLFCERKVGNKGAVSYRLAVLLRDIEGMPSKKKKKINIGGTFVKEEQARYLEQQIEAALGIQNRRVDGEYRP